MHVLLTRPLEDSIELIKKFKDKGFTVSHLPLIKINKLDHPKLNSSEYKIIIVQNIRSSFLQAQMQ